VDQLLAKELIAVFTTDLQVKVQGGYFPPRAMVRWVTSNMWDLRDPKKRKPYRRIMLIYSGR